MSQRKEVTKKELSGKKQVAEQYKYKYIQYAFMNINK